MMTMAMFLVVGCAASLPAYDRMYQVQSAGQVPCLPDEIETQRYDTHNWVAMCRGVEYVCRSTARGVQLNRIGGHEPDVSCVERK